MGIVKLISIRQDKMDDKVAMLLLLVAMFACVNAQIHTLFDEEFTQLKSKAESVRDLRRLQSHHSFKKFIRTHNKDYVNAEEYQKRFTIFKENMQKVQFLSETE